MNEEPFALRLAGALEQLYKTPPSVQQAAAELRRLHEQNTALRQALAEKSECETCAAKRKRLINAGFLKSPMRAEWQGLDDNEIQDTDHFCGDVFEFARAIEAKLKKRNT